MSTLEALRKIAAVTKMKAAPEVMPLVDALKLTLSATFALYFKAHVIHWNLVGIQFAPYHEYFGGLYEELHGAVDPIAEHIRALDAKAPASLADFLAIDANPERLTEESDFGTMLTIFDEENARLVGIFKTAVMVAGEIGEPGVQNFLQDRLDYHQKLAWQLRSIRQ
jgi:starvation-inducible DNA-binding protein